MNTFSVKKQLRTVERLWRQTRIVGSAPLPCVLLLAESDLNQESPLPGNRLKRGEWETSDPSKHVLEISQ